MTSRPMRPRPRGWMRPGPLPLRWRVAVALALGSTLIAALFALVTWNLASEYMLDQREQSASRQAAANERLVRDLLRSRPAEHLGDLLTGLAGTPDTTIALRNDDTWVQRGRPLDPTLLPEAVRSLVDSPSGGQVRATVDDIPVLAVVIPVGATDSRYLELFPLLELERTFAFLSAVLITGVVLSALLGLGLGRWASTRALRPLAELTAAAGRVARGDMHARLPEHHDADLAPLAATFNQTAAALEHRVRQDARFAADVSHELRSPLTTLINAVAVLQRRRDDLPPIAREIVDVLDADVQRFHKMVIDLLEISRTDSTAEHQELEACDLAQVVRHVVAVGPRDSPLHIDEPSPIVVADRRRLDRVVANLLDNADRHGGGATRVAVLDTPHTARIEIDDAGPGVPIDLRKRIFERFARGEHASNRNDSTGSGLGLALVDQHVRRYGGTAWVEDRPGGGARFVVELPKTRP